MRGLDPTILSRTQFSDLTVNPQPDSRVTLSQADGQVLSCQPDGRFQLRPPGTAGPYELCRLNGQTVTYCPAGVMFVYEAPEF